jgi:hypothetical protein
MIPFERYVVRRSEFHKFRRLKEPDLENGYRHMADDSERERAAEEWCEALIADATDIGDRRTC